MKTRYYKAKDGEPIAPNLKPDLYKLACCDCGLIHTMEFQVVRVIEENESGFAYEETNDPNLRVVFTPFRNNRATAQKRRALKRKKLGVFDTG